MQLFNCPRISPCGFDAFWDAYPRRVARIPAERAWKLAIKKASPEEIIAAVQTYSDGLGNTDPKFIMHAATFLNQCRWEDYRPKALDAESPERKRWRMRLKDYRPGSYWPEPWGPRPGEPDFQGPKDLEQEALAP